MNNTLLTGTALTAPWPTDLRVVFGKADGAEAIISRVRSEAMEHAKGLTVATVKDRKALASVAYDIAKRKSALDAAGKALNDDLRVSINAVDAERRRIRDGLEALQVEVRAPLTKWDADEAARVDALKARVERLRNAHVEVIDDVSSENISALLARVEATKIDDTWQEFVVDAARHKDQAVATVRNMLAIATKRDADAAELSRLRKDAEDRAEADRVRISSEQAETARVAAEKAEAVRLARIETEAQARIEAAEVAAEARAQAEAARQMQLARDRELTLQREKAEAETRHQKALADAQAREEAAAQAERNRMAAEQEAADTARYKREADQSHRAKIKGAISAALASMAGSATPDAIADALMAGKIPHVQVVM